MTEEEFYKEKIFNKVKLKRLKEMSPNFKDKIDLWYKSARYNEIQNRKTFLSNKIKQIVDENLDLTFSNEQMYSFFIWWENTPKCCHYCSLPESELENLHNLNGHVNKRYPKRGKSLEIDRKQSDLEYSNIDNLVLACYWCNNAKTDTFTEAEFLNIGRTIKVIWENRLGYNI